MRIHTETFVDGMALSDMSVDDLLEAVKGVKHDIKGLAEANEGVDSKNVAKMIETKSGQLKQLVEFLDSKKV